VLEEEADAQRIRVPEFPGGAEAFCFSLDKKYICFRSILAEQVLVLVIRGWLRSSPRQGLPPRRQGRGKEAAPLLLRHGRHRHAGPLPAPLAASPATNR
jgi:hypothetical protein